MMPPLIPGSSMNTHKNKHLDKICFLIMIFLFLVIMAMVVSVYANTPTPTPTVTPSVTPTPILHYVYLALENKSSGGEGTQSQRGDIVDIRPVRADTVPSGKSLNGYIIIKVAGLTQAEIDDLTSSEYHDEAKKKVKWYRKKRIDDLTGFKKGLNEGIYNFQVLKNKIKIKTSNDIARWRRGKTQYDFLEYVIVFGKIALGHGFVGTAEAATNISTINTAGEDYDTLTLWEADTDNDLVTATTIEQADCYDDQGALEDAVYIAGATVNSSYYRVVSVASGERHDGTDQGGGAAGTGFEFNLGNHFSYCIRSSENYTRIEWIKFDLEAWCTSNGIINYMDFVNIRNCIFYSGTCGSNNGVKHNAYDQDLTVENCLFQDINGSGINDVDSQASTRTYTNNTAVDCAKGYNIPTGGASVTLTNCIGYSNGDQIGDDDDFDCGANTVLDYCASDDDSADDYGGGNNKVNIGDPFENYAGNDFHLDAADTICKDAGTDMSGDFVDDYEGDSRDASWDMGCDEVTGGLPTETPTETATQTQTPTETQTQTITATQTVTATQTETVTATPTETQTQTQTVTATPTMTVTETPTPECGNTIATFGAGSGASYAGNWEDAYVDEANPTTIYGEGITLAIDNTTDNKEVVHLRVNINTLPDAIDITDDTFLAFYVESATGITAVTINELVGTPGNNWAESEDTWNEYNDDLNLDWTNENGGLDDDGTEYGSEWWNSDTGWHYIHFNSTGLTYLEGKAVSGVINLIITIDAGEAQQKDRTMTSKEGTDAQRPYLSVCYNPLLTQTATQTQTATPTETQTPTPTQTFTITATQTNTPTATQTITQTATETQTPTQTTTNTATPTLTSTATQTATLTATQTSTAIPSITSTPICYRYELYTVYYTECEIFSKIYDEHESFEVVMPDCESFEVYYYFGSN